VESHTGILLENLLVPKQKDEISTSKFKEFKLMALPEFSLTNLGG